MSRDAQCDPARRKGLGAAGHGDIGRRLLQQRQDAGGFQLPDALGEAFSPDGVLHRQDKRAAGTGDADQVFEPLDPDMAGTLAHEAFGHGVETDMFFKKRARAVDYLDRRVGSELVTMYDGAAGVDQTGSYLFDDEGVFSSKTCVIDKGILKGGISDTLSALALNLPLTGNGRREAYSHKAYARMTNTYFAPGISTLEDMIASIEHGWKLSQLDAGMEDPRNWGIQLICMVGREIKDGKFTGRVASPIVCSGYVPDVLSSVSMVSNDFELGGSGACGKGHKEYAKVSSGGPYVKTRMRLG